MSDKNIDKDIKVLELTIECLKETMEYEDIYKTEVSHIVISKKDMESFENVLSELETYKKIAEKLAEELSKHIWLNDKDAILKIYREKVEEDETYS